MPHVAVVLNGHIETIVPAPYSRWPFRRIVALLPEDRLTGEKQVSFYLVQGGPSTPSLAPLTLR